MLASQGHAPAKREGLGLGGVDMPAELGGSTRAVDPTLFDARFKPLKTPRTRHAPSLSSPPSLAPFAASLKASAAPPPVPTSRMSVVGAAPPSAAAAAGAPTSASSKRTALKHLSGGLISYPMVARFDSTPTYTPPPKVPPIATSVAAKVPPPPPPSGPPSSSSSSEPKKAGRGRPPPIKVGNAPGSSFLSPLKNRFGRAGKEKESAAAEAEEEAERSRSRTRRSKVDMLIAEVRPLDACPTR
ncbi:hypothetical protein DMC30DRAFT_137769 [Rhodotorula diobovata]|uniref:Uncharacterized protein n=1 Tax=Rhodotorula diobovata TaxID=5288 RepID=A0A5C5FLI9_9BASI|nr:hypothetical protein DMC30DRAFT_137769 [Rhodotorula diobovata]